MIKSYKYSAPKKTTRKCLLTGLNIDKKELIRFVIDPEKNLIADLDQSLPGRGYWVKANRQVILKAFERKIFFKKIKDNISINSNLLELMEEQIKQKLIQQISLSRKAGKTVFGFEKIKSLSLNNTISLLIQATDGSKREKKRILTKSVPKILDNCLNSAELGKPFGREKVIHCAILKSSFIEKIIFNANRLNNLKNPVPHYNGKKIVPRN